MENFVFRIVCGQAEKVAILWSVSKISLDTCAMPSLECLHSDRSLGFFFQNVYSNSRAAQSVANMQQIAMARTINVATSVFAAIWSRRQDGEETENDILARLLEVADNAEASAPSNHSAENGAVGVYDSRNKACFPQGFRAFRNYKNRKYEAVVKNGLWVRVDTSETYQTLNRLNSSFAVGLENVWNGNWKFIAEDGTIRPLDALRNTA